MTVLRLPQVDTDTLRDVVRDISRDVDMSRLTALRDDLGHLELPRGDDLRRELARLDLPSAGDLRKEFQRIERDLPARAICERSSSGSSGTCQMWAGSSVDQPDAQGSCCRPSPPRW